MANQLPSPHSSIRFYFKHALNMSSAQMHPRRTHTTARHALRPYRIPIWRPIQLTRHTLRNAFLYPRAGGKIWAVLALLHPPSKRQTISSIQPPYPVGIDLRLERNCLPLLATVNKRRPCKSLYNARLACDWVPRHTCITPPKRFSSEEHRPWNRTHATPVQSLQGQAGETATQTTLFKGNFHENIQRKTR